MDGENICCTLNQPWGWRQKFRARLLPFTPCETPEAPKAKDVIINKVRCELSFADRLRILITGRFEVESRIATKEPTEIMGTVSVTRAGRWWE